MRAIGWPRCLCLAFVVVAPAVADEPTRLAAHRGLMQHAPENTLAAFAVCLDLRLGFELDVRRSRDGQLVCLHDADVRRTTNGSGPVAEMPLAELRKLDAGSRFDPAFAGQRVPTLDEVFALIRERGPGSEVVAVDLKIDDEALAADVVGLAVRRGVLDRLVFIGRTIDQPDLRRRLRRADPKAPTAVLAQKPDQFAAAVADADAGWVYLRFVPTREQVSAAHNAGKRVFLAGTTVSGREPANWRRAREAGVDVILTDYPLECRESARQR